MASNDFISTLDEVAASADSVHEHVLRLHDAVESLESLDTDLPGKFSRFQQYKEAIRCCVCT